MRRIITTIAVVLALTLSVGAQAKPEYLDVLTGTYKSDSAKLSEKSCANCHVSDSDYTRNPYGALVAKELAARAPYGFLV